MSAVRQATYGASTSTVDVLSLGIGARTLQRASPGPAFATPTPLVPLEYSNVDTWIARSRIQKWILQVYTGLQPFLSVCDPSTPCALGILKYRHLARLIQNTKLDVTSLHRFTTIPLPAQGCHLYSNHLQEVSSRE